MLLWLLLVYFSMLHLCPRVAFSNLKSSGQKWPKMSSTSLSNPFKKAIGKVSIYIQSYHTEIKRSLGPQTEKNRPMQYSTHFIFLMHTLLQFYYSREQVWTVGHRATNRSLLRVTHDSSCIFYQRLENPNKWIRKYIKLHDML